MIIARIKGGLGNQLFCYAAARRLALVNNAELVIDDVSGFVRDYTHKRHYQLGHFNIPCRKAFLRERLEPLGRYRRWLIRKLSARKQFEQRGYLAQEFIDYDPRLLDLKVKGNIYLDGYWQSENYFKDVEQTIREDLSIIPPVDIVNKDMVEHICSHTAIALHIRFFDAPQQNGINNAPVAYYSRAIQEMENRVNSGHYFVFSDKPDSARACISLADDSFTLVSHNQSDENAYADLWLMSKCKHFIIANSTFSWWGAWLSSNPCKTIIAPGFEMREGKMWWGFDGLIPEDWIKR